MRYRDANGKFRRPTDEERWPDPVMREEALRSRAVMKWIQGPIIAETQRVLALIPKIYTHRRTMGRVAK